jgi:hypothetical protein
MLLPTPAHHFLLLVLLCSVVLCLQGSKPGSSSFKAQREAQRKGDAGNRCGLEAATAVRLLLVLAAVTAEFTLLVYCCRAPWKLQKYSPCINCMYMLPFSVLLVTSC